LAIFVSGKALSTIYQWLVVRGRLAISQRDSAIALELDPEGSAYCVLSIQDAREIAEIVTDVARTIWQASGAAPGPAARLEGDVHSRCTLLLVSGALQVMAHDEQPLIALAFESGQACHLSLAEATALVQILRHMTQALEARPAGGLNA
jgi:hypothetical protein